MATKRFSILGATLNLDNSSAVIPELASMSFAATGPAANTMVLRFTDPASRTGIYGTFTVPKDYVGTPKIIAIWASNTGLGNSVVWDFEYVAIGGDSSESLDPAAAQESLTVTDAESAGARQRQEAAISLTAANLAADDTVLYGFFRDGADAADTITLNAYLFDLMFEYSTT